MLSNQAGLKSNIFYNRYSLHPGMHEKQNETPLSKSRGRDINKSTRGTFAKVFRKASGVLETPVKAD